MDNQQGNPKENNQQQQNNQQINNIEQPGQQQNEHQENEQNSSQQYNQQLFNSQQYENQQNNNQPNNQQQYGSQPVDNQQYNNQPNNPQKFSGQPYGNQQNTNQLNNQQQYGNQPYGNQQNNNQPNGQQQYNSQQYGNQQYGNQQYGDQQHGNQQYGNQQYGNQQYSNQQYSNQQYNMQPNTLQNPWVHPDRIANSDVHQLRTKPRWIVGWSFFSLFIMAIAVILAQGLIEFLVFHFQPELAETNWFIWAETLISFVIIGFPVYRILIGIIPDSPKGETERMSPLKFIVIFFICTAAMYLSNIFTVALSFVIALIKGEEMINPLAEAMSGSNFIATLIYASIVAPIVEELVFRKFLLNKLRRFGDLPAILMTGLAFGLFHFNLSQFFYATVLGFIFAYVAIRTNTVKYTILLHMIINSIATMMTPVVTSGNMGAMLAIVAWELISISLGCVLFFVFIKKIKLQKVLPPAMKWYYYFLNPGVILYTILALILIIRVILM